MITPIPPNGVLYITSLPPSPGLTGPEWINRLMLKDFRLTEDATSLLLSKDFRPTTGVSYNLAILPATFFSDDRRRTRFIREEGQDRRWKELNPEAICILREYFSDDDLLALGFQWIVGIHAPIEFGFDQHLLATERLGAGRWLNAPCARPGTGWRPYGAFAWSL